MIAYSEFLYSLTWNKKTQPIYIGLDLYILLAYGRNTSITLNPNIASEEQELFSSWCGSFLSK